ncbi:hypothetical protein EZY14_000680 [Kordia sp. TARA_039_SRF]|nr:hypothetical protein EZY14_000680 [Kordia sp. TARA_039_SRF]
MIFKINYTENIENRTLIYREEEHSFDMNPRNHSIDLELAFNKLTMSVVDDKVIQLSGFCGLTKEMYSNIEIPIYGKGFLIVEHELESGFIYDISNEEFPVQFNSQTGWVCIGNTNKKGKGVEFINNCVAFISDRGEFLSLWLKPKNFPTDIKN